MLIVAFAIIVATIAYTFFLLKSNLEVVKSSKKSFFAQQLNAQELSKGLGNLQHNLNLYLIYRNPLSLDSVYFFEKEFQYQAKNLYQLTKNIPELRNVSRFMYFSFPERMKKIKENLKKLPEKLTLQSAVAGFTDNNGFSRYWNTIDAVRSYQYKIVEARTNETIAAGSNSWNVSIFGSIFMLATLLWGFFYIGTSLKKQSIAEAKERVSEAKRKENEKLFQAVLDNCTAGIFLKDKNFRYTLVNKGFEQIIKADFKDILGKTHFEVVGEKYPEEILSEEDRILSLGENRGSTQIIQHEYQKRFYLTNKFPLIDEEGEVFGLGGISTDITGQREYENELMRARELAEAAKVSQERFLANMSHEIRTPMNGVIGMTNLLEATNLNAEQEDYVKVIRQSSDILMLLINDILDVSKMQAGMLKLEKLAFDVRESVKQIFVSYKPLAAEMGIFLKCDIDESAPEFLMGDALRLNQVISNLVNNAIKFTSNGGVSIKVAASEIETDIVKLKIDVIDSGIGIPENKLEDVFNSFTQSSTSTTRKYGGTGLGLAIVKELVEMQGGTVHLTSQVNVGSTFTVTIPFGLAKIDKIQKQSIKSGLKFASLKNKKILVVEDNLINQKVARQILLNAGFEVVDVVDNGFKALNILQKTVYDAVLMDIQMPEIDGLETTRRIRNDLKMSVPIIALTASALAEDREICFKAGMNEYVTKPFLPEELLQKLSQLLQ